jgi:hypothetical protein
MSIYCGKSDGKIVYQVEEEEQPSQLAGRKVALP